MTAKIIIRDDQTPLILEDIETISEMTNTQATYLVFESFNPVKETVEIIKGKIHYLEVTK